MRRGLRTFRSISILAALLAALLIFTSEAHGQGTEQAATATAAATATSEATAGPAATASADMAATLPTVNWSDVSVYKQAMKPGSEGDVDKFVDSNRYLIVASLDTTSDAVITGAERVRYTNHTPDVLNTIVYRLYPNTPVLAAQMDVTNLKVNDQPVQPTLSQLNSVMTVPLATPLAKGASVEMTMDFDVIMKNGVDVSYGRFGYEHNVISATAWYPTLSVYDVGLGWWKATPSPDGDPAYTETGLYDVRLTTSADMGVAMSGTEIETTKNADGTITHHNVTGPMRDHAFQASTRYAEVSGTQDGVQVNVWHYKDQNPPQTDATPNVLQYAINALRTYDSTYGLYPFKEFDVVENPTPTGVEYPGLVQIAEREWTKTNDELEITVAHETGHQWFYSLVGDDQVNHPWLDEGLTSYTEFVYMRAIHPAKADAYIKSFQTYYTIYLGKGGQDYPVDMPVGSYSDAAYGAIVYVKSALFLYSLEAEIGQATVLKALNVYFHTYEYQVTTSKDVEMVFEQVSGKNLSTEFHKWVGTTG